jgi:hypothetical protein
MAASFGKIHAWLADSGYCAILVKLCRLRPESFSFGSELL